MKKLISFALSLFFASWLMYQAARLLQEVYLFLIILAGGVFTITGVIRYLRNKNRWY